MIYLPDNLSMRNTGSATAIPVTGFAADGVLNDAWAIHSALERAIRHAPALANDARFVAMRAEAAANWLAAFGGDS